MSSDLSSNAISEPSLTLLAIEHAMRITTDEAAVIRIHNAGSSPLSHHAALGALLSTTHSTLAAGSPLLAWCNGGVVDSHWRKFSPVQEPSLYATLETLRLVTTLVDTPANALVELWARRRLADELFDDF